MVTTVKENQEGITDSDYDLATEARKALGLMG
jgi:hypothetical protein